MDELISRTELLDKVKKVINPADINQYIVWCKLIKIAEKLPTIPQTDSETEYWKDLAKSYERTIVALQKGIAETQTNTAECDRNICLRNEYNGIGCDECEVTKAEQTDSYSWCKGCKEYDTENHCCHRYSSFIRETLRDNIDAVLEDIKTEITHLHEWAFQREFILRIIDKHMSGKEKE